MEGMAMDMAEPRFLASDSADFAAASTFAYCQSFTNSPSGHEVWSSNYIYIGSGGVWRLAASTGFLVDFVPSCGRKRIETGHALTRGESRRC